MLNRRLAIQQLLLVWAGATLLPACLQHDQKVSIPLKAIQVDGGDETMLADLAETILPKTDTPGARDLSAHLFVLKMVDDCYPKADQVRYIQGMKDFEAFVKTKTGNRFTDSSPQEKLAIVAEVNQQKPDSNSMTYFYQTTKKLTVEAYTTCEYFLTKIRGYKMIPGKFQGCVPLKTV